MQTFVVLGGILMAIGVAMGAFGAHALKDRLGAKGLTTFRTGVQYHLIHALGMVAVGILAGQYPDDGRIPAAGWLILAGIILFSGSLYVLSVKKKSVGSARSLRLAVFRSSSAGCCLR